MNHLMEKICLILTAPTADGSNKGFQRELDAVKSTTEWLGWEGLQLPEFKSHFLGIFDPSKGQLNKVIWSKAWECSMENTTAADLLHSLSNVFTPALADELRTQPRVSSRAVETIDFSVQ